MTINTAKKGITAVVAIVLLLMMTVAAAGLAYMWISQMQTGTQQKTSEQLNTQAQQMQSSLNIESVWASGGMMFFSLRNTGSTTVDLTYANGARFYVNGAIQTANPTGMTGLITPGATFTVQTAAATGGAWPGVGATNAKTVQVVTVEGVSTEYKCMVSTATATTC